MATTIADLQLKISEAHKALAIKELADARAKLRDEFAMRAMAAYIIANPEASESRGLPTAPPTPCWRPAMRTANLTGALLDWHTARAEGVPTADLELRANGTLCVRNIRGTPGKIVAVQVLDYSTNWALSGPLVEKREINLHRWKDDTEFWAAEFAYKSHYHDVYASDYEDEGCDTPLIAICRAVVRAAFGDEVEDLP